MFHLLKTKNNVSIRHEDSFENPKSAIEAAKKLQQDGFFVTLKEGTRKEPLLIFESLKEVSENA